jgi:flavin-dependent dehydrogenase
MTHEYDCLVIGGGPAGATVAALLARAGRSTLLVERERMPRCRGGASLAPACGAVLGHLGLLDAVNAAGFPRHAGWRLVDHQGTGVLDLPFQDGGIEQGWHVPRASFDQMLFDQAAASGAVCRNRTRLVEVLFDGERAVGARLEGPGELREETIAARVIVDASGQQAILANRLGLRAADARLPHAAIWTCYHGGVRDAGSNGKPALIVRAADGCSWFWYLPLPDDMVSVGVVSRADHLLGGRGKPESVFEEELVRCPAVAERLIDARLADDFRTTRDYAFSVPRAAGEGWLLVGDAGGFLDPLFGMGVWLALRSGERAAGAVIDALDRGDASAARLGRWLPEHQAGVERWRRLVYAFYTVGFCLKQFVDQHPQHRPGLCRLLAGDLFNADLDGLLAELDAWQARGPAAAGNSIIESTPLT